METDEEERARATKKRKADNAARARAAKRRRKDMLEEVRDDIRDLKTRLPPESSKGWWERQTTPVGKVFAKQEIAAQTKVVPTPEIVKTGIGSYGLSSSVFKGVVGVGVTLLSIMASKLLLSKREAPERHRSHTGPMQTSPTQPQPVKRQNAPVSLPGVVTGIDTKAQSISRTATGRTKTNRMSSMSPRTGWPQNF